MTLPNVMEGLIFIPDISGFTELVRSADLLTGKQITGELLSVVISRNKLNLNISEIEGDAFLFYRYVVRIRKRPFELDVQWANRIN